MTLTRAYIRPFWKRLEQPGNWSGHRIFERWLVRWRFNMVDTRIVPGESLAPDDFDIWQRVLVR